MTIVERQDKIEVFVNHEGNICVRREVVGDNDCFVWIEVQHAKKVADAIIEAMKEAAEETEESK